MKKNIVTIFYGTRPELYKIIQLVREFKKDLRFDTQLIYTNQHKDSLESTLIEYNIKNDAVLNINRDNPNLDYFISKLISETVRILRSSKSNYVVVHGDTASAYAVALSSFLLGIPIIHVEAGLRTYNMNEPFPEEFFRRSIDSIADLHLAPTYQNKENLIREGIPDDKIIITGNTIIDLLKENTKGLKLDKAELDSRTVLITMHRRENIPKMEVILSGIKSAVESLKQIRFILPMHKNPIVRQKIIECLSSIDNLELVEPIEVKEFHRILFRAEFVITDSGGIQEECSSLGVPTIVVRETTERSEALRGNNIQLVEINSDLIKNKIIQTAELSFMRKRNPEDTYGNGNSSMIIVNAVFDFIQKK